MLIAASPLIVAIVLLAGLQRSGRLTGLVTAATSIVVAISVTAFHLDPSSVALAAARGAASALVVLYVLLPGLVLFHLQRRSGSLNILASAIDRLTPDRESQILLLVLGIAPFVESVSGFGVSIVVVIPLFRAMGIVPTRAAVLGALGQVAVPWGALAIGIVLGAQLTHMDAAIIGARTALVTAPIPIMHGLLALGLVGGWPAVRRRWLSATVAGLTLVACEWWFSLYVSVEMAGALAGFFSICVLVLLGRAVGPARLASTTYRDDPGIALSGHSRDAIPAGEGLHRQADSISWRAETTTLARAMLPYALLTVLLLATRTISPLGAWLNTLLVIDSRTIDLRIPAIFSAGFWVLLAALVAGPAYRLSWRSSLSCWRAGFRQFHPAATAIVGFLVAAQVMRESGMTESLAVAAAGLGYGYIALAPVLAALGGWLTGSNAGSNAMFAVLHQATGQRLGLPLDWLMGAQNGAASLASLASPARLILAAATAGSLGGEARLMRLLGPVVLLGVVVIAALFGLVVLLDL